MRYVIPTKVRSLEFKKKVTGAKVDKSNKDTVTIETVDLGWFVLFEGSCESLFVGYDQPEGLDPGSKVKIIIETKG